MTNRTDGLRGPIDLRPLVASTARLAAAFPTAERGDVAARLATAYRRTEGARVQQYRMVLAEREVRRDLRRPASPDAITSAAS